MMWINVKDRLPEHMDKVLVCNSVGMQVVVVFLDQEKFNKELISSGINIDDIPISNVEITYMFCSQEIKGNHLIDVSHWMPLPELPKDKPVNSNILDER